MKRLLVMLSISFLISSLIISSKAYALSEKAIFARCYAQLTNQPVQANHPLFALVKNGKLSAADACLQIFNKATLQNSGMLQNVNDTESVAVLNNFYEFHRTWFPTAYPAQINGYQAEFDTHTAFYIDFTAPALILTESLFGKTPYKNVLRADQRLYPVRVTEPHFFGTERILFPTLNNEAVPISDMGPFSSTGNLTGITTNPFSLNVQNYAFVFDGFALEKNKISAEVGFDLYSSLGAGLLGQPSYFLLNSGHPKGLLFNGSTKLPRKWAKTTLESLLCYQLPALRESDVTQYLVSPGNDQTAPFRKGVSCLTCHATMDQFATTARNLSVQQSMFGNSKKTILVGKTKTLNPAISYWSSEPVPQFFYQNPTGRLYLRSYATGKLINQPVSSLNDLGEKLSELDEYYQCATKRYFNFFTGINVSLYDRTNPANASLNKNLTPQDIKDREFIEKLAVELKKTQSLQRLVELILKSDYYKKAQFNPGSSL